MFNIVLLQDVFRDTLKHVKNELFATMAEEIGVTELILIIQFKNFCLNF